MDVPPPRFLLSLNYALEGLDTEGLAGLVEETESKHGVKVWLLTRSGREMLDRDAPEHAVQLAQELRGRPRLALGEHGGERLYAHDIYNNKIGHFRAVVAVPVYEEQMGQGRARRPRAVGCLVG